MPTFLSYTRGWPGRASAIAYFVYRLGICTTSSADELTRHASL